MYLVITRSYPPEIGGMQNLMWGLTNSLSKYFMIKVYADEHNQSEDYDKKVSFSIERVGGIKLLRKYRKAHLVNDFIKKNKNIRGIIADHWKSLELIKTKKKKICLIHSKEINHNKGSFVNKRILKVLNNTNHIISNSRYTKDLAVSCGINRNKIKVINPGVNPIKEIDKHIELLDFRPDEKYKISRGQLVESLMEDDGGRLIIFQGDDERALQKLSNEIIVDQRHGVYYKRKHTGQTRPLTTFVFDEADKFISSRRVAESDKASREAVETVVRRGRKIGLGALIATQRMALLDTNIISQLHTYFISKLPRKEDQQKVVEGFGMGVDMLVETFKFFLQ
mgnify:CR=1 FL=1